MLNVLNIKRSNNNTIFMRIGGFVSLLLMILCLPITHQVIAFTNPYTNGLDIEPMNFKIDLISGEIYKNSIRVENITDSPITFKINILPYTEGNSGAPSFDLQTSESEIINWTSMLHNKESSITLDAGEWHIFDFVIDVPKNVDIKTQKETIMFEAIAPDEQGVLSNVGVVIFADIVKPYPINFVIGVVLTIIVLIALILLFYFKYKKKHIRPLRRKEKNKRK